MTDYTLHGFSESGNAYKVALMLVLNGADWACERIPFFTGGTKTDAFRAINVMAEAPVLVHHRDDGDFTLSQSGACLTYLAKQFGTYGPQTEAEEYDVLRWLLFDSQKVSGYAGPLRFMRTFAKIDEGELTKNFDQRLGAALKAMDLALADRPFLTGDRCTIADLACQGYLHWPEQIGITFDKRPNIEPWLERVKAMPGWKKSEDLMPSGRKPETMTS
ncbi:MAG: glutathione S-transferase family protein [Pseudomonadota bacterium]